MKVWKPWVADCLRLLDGDGAYQHYFFDGSLAVQPAIYMVIFDEIRHKWVELRNAAMKRSINKK